MLQGSFKRLMPPRRRVACRGVCFQRSVHVRFTYAVMLEHMLVHLCQHAHTGAGTAARVAPLLYQQAFPPPLPTHTHRYTCAPPLAAAAPHTSRPLST